MKKNLFLSILAIMMTAILSAGFMSCSSDDGSEEFGYSGDLNSILTQYGWTSDYNDNYLIGDDYINVTTDAGTLFFLENGEGIERYERHDYDTDLGSSSKTTPVPFTYTVNGSTVTINWPTIRSVSYSHSESYRYQNGALIPLDANVVGGYKSFSILSSDRKWLEDAKYYVMDDDERLNIDITLKIEPKGGNKDGYYLNNRNDGYYVYEFHMKVPASVKAEARKISNVRATFWYPDNNKDRVTLIISGNNTDSSTSGYLYVKESSLPGTMHVQYEVFDNKNAHAYEYIKSEEYELSKKSGDNEGNGSGNSATVTQSGSNMIFHVGNVDYTMVYVQGGTFTMGGTSEQGSDADSDESPTHSVTLSSYYIGETEVTQELWQAVMRTLPSGISSSSYDVKGPQRPVCYVNWDDCQTFISRLNSLTGQQFHLPTEAQWEYAARGGNRSQGYKYSGSNDVGSVAWYTNNTNEKGSCDVKTKSPNELGLYDMSGNVSEWCQDRYGSYSSNSQTNPTGASSGSDRVDRGGSWLAYARSCRVSYRWGGVTVVRSSNRGLRLAL